MTGFAIAAIRRISSTFGAGSDGLASGCMATASHAAGDPPTNPCKRELNGRSDSSNAALGQHATVDFRERRGAMRKVQRWFVAAAAAVAAAATVTAVANSSDGSKPPGLQFLGQAIVPTGTTYAGTTVGGLSSITYDSARGVFYSLSDDQSQFNPARFYTLQVDLSAGHLADGDVQFSGVTTLLAPGAHPALQPGHSEPRPAVPLLHRSDRGAAGAVESVRRQRARRAAPVQRRVHALDGALVLVRGAGNGQHDQALLGRVPGCGQRERRRQRCRQPRQHPARAQDAPARPAHAWSSARQRRGHDDRPDAARRPAVTRTRQRQQLRSKPVHAIPALRPRMTKRSDEAV